MKKIKFNKNKKPIYLTIGNFDGVHIGHQKIIRALLKKGKEKNIEKSVLTFSPHPLKSLYPDKAPKMISSLRHRIRMLFS